MGSEGCPFNRNFVEARTSCWQQSVEDQYVAEFEPDSEHCRKRGCSKGFSGEISSEYRRLCRVYQTVRYNEMW